MNPNPANQVIARFPSGYFCSQPTTSAIPVSWLSGCFNYLTNNADAIRALYGLPSGLAAENPGRYYQIEEKSTAAYAQLGYGNTLFGIPFDGLLGMRVERMKRNLSAYSYDASTNVYSPLSDSTSSPVYLPNLSFNLHFTNDLQLRLVGAKTITYPGFGAFRKVSTMKVCSLNEVELYDRSEDRFRRSPCHLTPIAFWISWPRSWCACVLVAA